MRRPKPELSDDQWRRIEPFLPDLPSNAHWHHGAGRMHRSPHRGDDGHRKIDIWDNDTIDKKNLHRLLGAKKMDIGKNKARVLVKHARQFATVSPANIEAHENRGRTETSLRKLLDCDIVFSCVDKFAPRVALNDLAYAHLILPVVPASLRSMGPRRSRDEIVQEDANPRALPLIEAYYPSPLRESCLDHPAQ